MPKYQWIITRKSVINSWRKPIGLPMGWKPLFIELNVLVYCAKKIKWPKNTLRIIANLNDLYIAYCMKFYILFFQKGYIMEHKRKRLTKIFKHILKKNMVSKCIRHILPKWKKFRLAYVWCSERSRRIKASAFTSNGWNGRSDKRRS